MHVLEYLWRAAYAFHEAGSNEAEKWVEARLLALLNGRSAGQVAKSLRAMIKSHKLDASAAKPVERAAKYLVNNTQLLHYDRALADGLPIATGVIEGAITESCQSIQRLALARMRKSAGSSEPAPYLAAR